MTDITKYNWAAMLTKPEWTIEWDYEDAEWDIKTDKVHIEVSEYESGIDITMRRDDTHHYYWFSQLDLRARFSLVEYLESVAPEPKKASLIAQLIDHGVIEK